MASTRSDGDAQGANGASGAGEQGASGSRLALERELERIAAREKQLDERESSLERAGAELGGAQQYLVAEQLALHDRRRAAETELAALAVERAELARATARARTELARLEHDERPALAAEREHVQALLKDLTGERKKLGGWSGPLLWTIGVGAALAVAVVVVALVLPAAESTRAPAAPSASEPSAAPSATAAPEEPIAVFDGAVMSIATRAPSRIEWRTLGDLLVGRGSATVLVPPDTRQLVARDPRRRVDARVSATGGHADYDDVPRGRISFAALEAGLEVYLGDERLGVTPLPELGAVAGSYAVRVGGRRLEIAVRAGRVTAVPASAPAP